MLEVGCYSSFSALIYTEKGQGDPAKIKYISISKKTPSSCIFADQFFLMRKVFMFYLLYKRPVSSWSLEYVLHIFIF